MTSIEETLAAVLRAEVEKRVAAVQLLADMAVADMQKAADRLQNATSAPSAAPERRSTTTAVAAPVVLQAPMQPPAQHSASLAGSQLAQDDPRLHGRGFEVTNSPIGLVRSGWIATGSSLPVIAGGN
jgi:hypothetical protein